MLNKSTNIFNTELIGGFVCFKTATGSSVKNIFWNSNFYCISMISPSRLINSKIFSVNILQTFNCRIASITTFSSFASYCRLKANIKFIKRSGSSSASSVSGEFSIKFNRNNTKSGLMCSEKKLKWNFISLVGYVKLKSKLPKCVSGILCPVQNTIVNKLANSINLSILLALDIMSWT